MEASDPIATEGEITILQLNAESTNTNELVSDVNNLEDDIRRTDIFDAGRIGGEDVVHGATIKDMNENLNNLVDGSADDDSDVRNKL